MRRLLRFGTGKAGIEKNPRVIFFEEAQAAPVHKIIFAPQKRYIKK
jgi:hypothetical protein